MNTAHILSFLEELQRNNSKTWMDAHRAYYQEARTHFSDIVQAALNELQSIDHSLYGLTPQECMFRINKNDFSRKDQAPYKGRMGAGMSPGGRHSAFANYILVLEPGNKSRIGGGMPNPSPAQVSLVREEIDYNPGELESILNDPAFKGYFGELKGDKLLTTPKGYDKSHSAIELLRHKNYLALHYFSDEEVKQTDFLERLLPIYKAVKPLHDFLNRTIL